MKILLTSLAMLAMASGTIQTFQKSDVDSGLYQDVGDPIQASSLLVCGAQCGARTSSVCDGFTFDSGTDSCQLMKSDSAGTASGTPVTIYKLSS